MDRRTLLRASGVGALAGVTTMAAATPAQASAPAPNSWSSWLMARKLIANGPFPEHADALNVYGQFVGSWDATASELFGDRITYPVGWHFGWILQGRGVQDVFDRLDKPDDRGTTIRIYDPVEDNWVVSWYGPASRTVRHFHAQQVGDEIIQSGVEWEDPEGNRYPMRWIFHDIEENHFLWRNEISFDGETWTVVVRIDATRRGFPRR